jgi:hypothetical protein
LGEARLSVFQFYDLFNDALCLGMLRYLIVVTYIGALDM